MAKLWYARRKFCNSNSNDDNDIQFLYQWSNTNARPNITNKTISLPHRASMQQAGRVMPELLNYREFLLFRY